MVDQLERELRSALAQRADEVPRDAGQRVRGHEYRPRSRSVRSPVAAGALAVAAAAAVAVFVVGLGTGTPEAFAGWSATPTHAPEHQVSSAESGCLQRLASEPTPPNAPAGAPQPLSTAGLSPVLTDTRGPFTFVIFASDSASASCITGPSFTSLNRAGSSQSIVTPAGQIQLSQASNTARSGAAYSFAEGRTGAGVTGVTLLLADGTHIQATAENGWFVAWWPGASAVTDAQVATAQGTTTQHINAASPPPCAAGATCSSGSSAAGSSRGSASGSGHASGSTSVQNAN
jgi:hypothetical protein